MASLKSVLKYISNPKNYLSCETIYLFEQKLNNALLKIETKTDRGKVILVNNAEEFNKSKYDLSSFSFLEPINKKKLWENGILFLYTVEDKLAHLSWVATEGSFAYSDPFFKNSKRNDAGYIGPCFTLKEFRGLSIYPHILFRISQYLRERGKKKAQILTRQANSAGVRGIEKAGFKLVAHLSCFKIMFRDFYRLKYLEKDGI